VDPEIVGRDNGIWGHCPMLGSKGRASDGGFGEIGGQSLILLHTSDLCLQFHILMFWMCKKVSLYLQMSRGR